MTYFYEFELILAGIILLSTMGFAGTRLWLKRRSTQSETQTHSNYSDTSAQSA
jgi:hypothetical protein